MSAGPQDSSSDQPVSPRLNSWKEIAAYLGRDARTVQRWEKNEGLPVHRYWHESQASVYATTAELDGWLANRGRQSPSPPEPRWQSVWRRPATKFAAAFALTVIAGLVLWLAFREPVQPFLRSEVEPLIAAGNATAAVVSPDGRYLAFVLAETGGPSLWRRDLGSGVSAQLAESGQFPNFPNLSFSPDGDFLRFGKAGVLHQMPILGGPASGVGESVPGDAKFSPDGKRIAYRRATRDGESAIIVAGADNTGARKLAIRKQPESLVSIAWSPDGRQIAAIEGTSVFAGVQASIILLDPDSGRETRISTRKWWSVGELAWLQNGRGLVFIGREPPVRTFRIWYMSYPDGEARPITNDLMDYTTFSLTADSGSIVSRRTDELSGIWVAPSDGTSAGTSITEGLRRKDGVGGMAWTRDGRLVYVSSFTGIMQLWIAAADGRNPMRLTAEGATAFNPSVCPNDRYVIYNSDPVPTGRHIWRQSLDGSPAQQLTSGSNDEASPICSSDSKWVMYVAVTARKYSLMKIPIEGGTPVPITDEEIIMPSLSPDGKTILGTIAAGPRNQVVTIPWEGGPVRRLFDIERPKVHWSADGKAVYYVKIENGVRNVWRHPLNGGSPQRVTAFTDSEDIRWFAVAPAGERLAVARGATIRDVVRIRDLK